MFMGEYQHSVDPKGRLIIPARFRDELGEHSVMTRGLDNCLFLFPIEEWKVLEAKLKTLPLTKADARQFVRFFFSGANECLLDKQGRVIIPQTLRDYAGINREVAVVGVSNRMEIWSKERWQTYVEQASSAYGDIAENIVELGI